MKRMLLAAVAAIVLSVGIGSVAQAAPHSGHRSHGSGHGPNIRVYTPNFSFGYGGHRDYGVHGGHGGHSGYRGYGGHGGYWGGLAHAGNHNNHHRSW